MRQGVMCAVLRNPYIDLSSFIGLLDPPPEIAGQLPDKILISFVVFLVQVSKRGGERRFCRNWITDEPLLLGVAIGE
jgi:hypothetical protein